MALFAELLTICSFQSFAVSQNWKHKIKFHLLNGYEI